MKYLFLISLLLFGCACRKVELRPDPFASPLDTKDHALLLQYCDKFGTSVACQVPQDSGVAQPLTIYAPTSGRVEIIGCGVNTAYVIDQPGPSSFILPDPPGIQKDGSGCILDIFYSWNVPKKWRSQVPVRGMRGKIFLQRVSRMSTPASLSVDNGPQELGAIAIKLPIGFESANHKLDVLLSQESQAGFFRLHGCNTGIPKREFAGKSIPIALSELTPSQPTQPSECLYYGFAVDKRGLVDTFALGLTTYSRDAAPLAVNAWRDGKKVCYEAEKYVSLTTFGRHIRNGLKGCFESDDNGVVSFYSVQGRARHALIQEDKIEWVK